MTTEVVPTVISRKTEMVYVEPEYETVYEEVCTPDPPPPTGPDPEPSDPPETCWKAVRSCGETFRNGRLVHECGTIYIPC